MSSTTEENLAPDISNESRLGYISNNRAENMPRSRIVEFDLAGETEQIGELYYGGPLRNFSEFRRNEEKISITLAKLLEKEFDMCVVNLGSVIELPYTGLACNREQRVLFTGTLEETEDKGDTLQAEARGNLIAIEKSLVLQNSRADDLLQLLRCQSPFDDLCGRKNKCFECSFNRELFDYNPKESSGEIWSDKVRIIIFDNPHQLSEKIDEFLDDLFPSQEQEVLAMLDRTANIQALKTFTIYSENETQIEIPHTNLLTLIRPTFPETIEFQERNRTSVCELRVFLYQKGIDTNLSSVFRIIIDQLISSIIGISIDDCVGKCLVRQPMLFESESTTLRNVVWMQNPSWAVTPFGRLTLFSNKYVLESIELSSRDDFSELAKNLQDFDKAVTTGKGLAGLRLFWESERNGNCKSIQAFFALAHSLDPELVPLIPKDSHDFGKITSILPQFVHADFSIPAALGYSTISPTVPNMNIEKIHKAIIEILRKITPDQIQKFIDTIAGADYNGFKHKKNWGNIIERSNCLEYFQFLLRSNKVAADIWDDINNFAHVDEKLRDMAGHALTNIKSRIYIPKLYKKYASFLIIINDFVDTTEHLPKWFKERYFLVSRGFESAQI